MSEFVITANKQGVYYHSTSNHIQYENVVAPVIKKSEEYPFLNPIQRNMYRRLMYGLDYYQDYEKRNMSNRTLRSIERDAKKAAFILQRAKVQKLFTYEDMLLNAIFPHAKIGTKPEDYSSVRIPREFTLARLGLTPRKIIDLFISDKLLPDNFFSISESQPL